jgi:hypothetical protein
MQLLGDVNHPDFEDAVAMLRESAELLPIGSRYAELVVVAQSRPDSVDRAGVEALLRSSPFAGAVALLGSWCEGETRTGRPWPGTRRLYWYEFPAWWSRQLALRSMGRCPEWARPDSTQVQIAQVRVQHDFPASSELRGGSPARLVALHCTTHETTEAISDVLSSAGYATVRQPYRTVIGAAAGIWEGGQLSSVETADLFRFCRRLGAQHTPVLALLDFPRRDKVDEALSLGAHAVIAKPWNNVALLETLNLILKPDRIGRAA